MEIKRNGLTFNVRPETRDAIIILEVYQDNFYLPSPEYQILPGQTVVDLGAHIGVFSLGAAKKGANVYSYEPMAESYALLEKNIQANPGLTGTITPFNMAVVKDDFDVGLLQKNKEPVCNKIVREKSDGFTYEEVKTISIDKVLKQFTVIDYLKIDVEGLEWELLNGTDLSNVRRVVMETHFDYLMPLTNLLKSSGWIVGGEVNQGAPRQGRLYAINNYVNSLAK